MLRAASGKPSITRLTDRLSIHVSPATVVRTHLTSRLGRDGSGDDASNTPVIEFNWIGFVILGQEDDNLQLRRTANQLRNGIGGARYQLALEQDHVGGKALDGVVKTCQAIGLLDHPDIGFARENFLHADPIDPVRIGQDNANRSVMRALVVDGGGQPPHYRGRQDSRPSPLLCDRFHLLRRSSPPNAVQW